MTKPPARGLSHEAYATVGVWRLLQERNRRREAVQSRGGGVCPSRTLGRAQFTAWTSSQYDPKENASRGWVPVTVPVPATPRNKPQIQATGRPAAARLRPCATYLTMRGEKGMYCIPVPSRSRTAQRKRRLHNGLQFWDFDRRNSPEPTWRIAVLTLTIAGSDLELAAGAARRFWADVRRTWVGTRYFCWLELQQRGQVHYHAVWLNPPSRRRVDLLQWVSSSWGMGRTQVRFSDGRQGIEKELAYAQNYAKKMGKKSYQQNYEKVPSTLRTFMCQRLEIKPAEAKNHIPRDIWVYRRGKSANLPLFSGVAPIWREHLELVSRQAHDVPAGGYCSANDAAVRKRRPPGRQVAHRRVGP